MTVYLIRRDLLSGRSVGVRDRLRGVRRHRRRECTAGRQPRGIASHPASLGLSRGRRRAAVPQARRADSQRLAGDSSSGHARRGRHVPCCAAERLYHQGERLPLLYSALAAYSSYDTYISLCICVYVHACACTRNHISLLFAFDHSVGTKNHSVLNSLGGVRRWLFHISRQQILVHWAYATKSRLA